MGGRLKKGHNRWKKSKTTTRKNYLKNITLKFDFSTVVIGSDIKAVLYAFKRDLPLFIEKEHFTLEEQILSNEDLKKKIQYKDFDNFKSSLLFVMNLNGKVFGFETLNLERNIIKTQYDKFFINNCYYSKLVDPFKPAPILTVIDKITVELPNSKKNLFNNFEYVGEDRFINKILSCEDALYSISYLTVKELLEEDYLIFNVKFQVQEILANMGQDYSIIDIDRFTDQHRSMQIEFDNYHDISNLSIEDILDTDKESINMEIYGKLGQNIF